MPKSSAVWTEDDPGWSNATEALFEPHQLQMALSMTTSLASLTLGEHVVVVNSEFDVTVHGEPYLALMFLLNVRTGMFMARQVFNSSIVYSLSPYVLELKFNLTYKLVNY